MLSSATCPHSPLSRSKDTIQEGYCRKDEAHVSTSLRTSSQGVSSGRFLGTLGSAAWIRRTFKAHQPFARKGCTCSWTPTSAANDVIKMRRPPWMIVASRRGSESLAAYAQTSHSRTLPTPSHPASLPKAYPPCRTPSSNLPELLLLPH